MKAVVLALVLCQAVYGSKESNDELDRLLAIDGIKLTPRNLQFRRGIFAVSWLLKKEGETLNLEAMYTARELERQKGARKAPDFVLDNELQKREEVALKDLKTPSMWDQREQKLGSGEPLLNKVANQEKCGNCYIHTWAGALEIAYAKASGNRIKFSEQELTDCYFRGCDGGDVRMVSKWMAYIDKLSTKEDYGDYLSDTFTCRATVTPDSLLKLKVVDAIEITLDTVEAAVVYYGSVMTCMKWGDGEGSTCRMDNYDGKSVINYPAVKDGCDHAVLIVGYTDDHYIVRNSHGATWGDEGYFYIKRGINSCGIEDLMVAIKVENRIGSKNVAPNGCPLDMPNYCEDSNTCTAKLCLQEQYGRVKREEKKYRLPGPGRTKRDEKKKEKKFYIHGQVEEKRSTATNEKLVEKEKRNFYVQGLKEEKRSGPGRTKRSGCSDTHPSCAMLMAMMTCANPLVTQYCSKSCDSCAVVEELVEPDVISEKEGKCYRPTIANSQVEDHNPPIMEAGMKLRVECNDGYTLVGKPVKCLIQDVFTNEDKDGRLMPACIKLGDETLKGNGATYTGSRNSFTDAMGNKVECDNWNKDVLEGYLMNDPEADKYALGNHNYCRNPGGTAPVPVCLSPVDDVVTEVYCFQAPGCDTCVGAKNAPQYSDSYCKTGMKKGKCDYVDSTSLDLQQFYWEKCQKTCCAKSCPIHT